MRAIVARDERGQYHPGLRNSYEHGPEYKTVYQDFTSYRDKDRAIGEAKTMLKETLENHEQTRHHLAETESRVSSLLKRASTPTARDEAADPTKTRGRSIDR
jgi:hypothetical protein